MPQLRRRGLPAPGVVRGVHVARRGGAPPGASRDAVDVDHPGLRAQVAAVRRDERPRTSSPTASATSSSQGEVRVEARLTENDPAELRIGMPMELVRRPGSATTTAARSPSPSRPRRTGMSTMTASRSSASASIPSAAIAGVSGLAQAAVAARAALDGRRASAGRRCSSPFGRLGRAGNADTMVSDLGLTGLPFINVHNGCATGGSRAHRPHHAILSPARTTSAWSSASTSTRAARSTRRPRTGASATGTARPA